MRIYKYFVMIPSFGCYMLMSGAMVLHNRLTHKYIQNNRIYTNVVISEILDNHRIIKHHRPFGQTVNYTVWFGNGSYVNIFLRK